MQRATRLYHLNDGRTDGGATISRKPIWGAKFWIQRNEDGTPTMKWVSTCNKTKPFHPHDVLEFCCKHVIPLVPNESRIMGFTEHNRFDEMDDTKYLFRSHPSYRKDSGQVSAVWYDWALFSIDGKKIPCQILCFVFLPELKEANSSVEGYRIDTAGPHAIVRRFFDEPKPLTNPSSGIVKEGKVMNRLFLFPCESILSDIAVLPNIMSVESSDRFLVIENRHFWLELFRKRILSIGQQYTKKSLLLPSKQNDEELTQMEEEEQQIKDTAKRIRNNN